MDISLTDKDLYVFGSFVLDPVKRSLLRDGVPVPLSPKVFDTLLYLAQHPGRLLDKDELLDGVWPGRVVEENNLSHNISLLRKVLGGDSALDRCIVTAPGSGYRFTANPQRIPRKVRTGDAAAAAKSEIVPLAGDGAATMMLIRSPPGRRALLAAAALLLLMIVAYFAVTRFAPPRPARASIAVLPFENLSNDKNNSYFTAGVQELILTKLADAGDLKVIARASTEQYASHPPNLETIGRELGVATILEGSVQEVGNQVLINAQLVDARTATHIWAQAYTRNLDNVIGVEGEVAEQVAAALDAKLSSAQSTKLAAVPTHNQTAYDLFLRAEYQANRGDDNSSTASWKIAIILYRQAIGRDPDFALAWARVSYIESELAWFGGGGGNVKDINRQARADAARALQLQPDLAAAHLAAGYSEYWGSGDYNAALKAFTAALKLEPGDANALAARGYVERRQGRFDAATESLQGAFALDPRNSALAFQLAMTYMDGDRYAGAENIFQRVLALDPNNQNAKVYLANAIELSTGDIAAALAAVRGDDPSLQFARVALLTDQRKYRDALDLLDRIPDTDDNFGYAGAKLLMQANMYRLMGDEVRARSLYAQALPHARAQLRVQQGINLVPDWESIAGAELELGQTRNALRAVAKAQAILDETPDRSTGPPYRIGVAELYAWAGHPDLAVPQLAKTLEMPGIGPYYSPVMLWLDAGWDPIRRDARFQALLAQYARYKPRITYLAPAPASPL